MTRLSTEELEEIRKRKERGEDFVWLTYNTGPYAYQAREDIPKLLAEIERLRKVLSQIDELSDDFYTIESIDGAPTFVLRPELEEYRETIQEITVVSYEGVNE